MTARRPRDIGTAAETAVVKYLRPNGFPHAERRALRGTNDAGDITSTPALCWSVKGGDQARNASDLDITTWQSELATQVQNAGAEVGVLVVQRKAVGPDNAHRWWAIMPAWQVGYLATGLQSTHLDPNLYFPVRMLLADAVSLLRDAGYGDPMEVPSA